MPRTSFGSCFGADLTRHWGAYRLKFRLWSSNATFDILLEIGLSGAAEQRSTKVKLEIPSHSIGDIMKESFE